MGIANCLKAANINITAKGFPKISKVGMMSFWHGKCHYLTQLHLWKDHRE
jgi:hypothetical protein